MIERVKHDMCTKCKLRKPQSLLNLTCAEVLANQSLLNAAVCIFHSVVISALMNVAVNLIMEPGQEGTFWPIKILLAHWPYEILDVELVSRRRNCNGILAQLVLEQFVNDHNLRTLHKTSCTLVKDLVMKNGNMLFRLRFLTAVSLDATVSLESGIYLIPNGCH